MAKDTAKEKENGKGLNSVKTRLILVMMAVVVIPLVISIVVSYASSINKGLEDAMTINDSQAKIIEESFMASIDQQLRSLQAIADSPYTIEYIKNAQTRDDAQMIAYIAKVNENYNDGNAIVISDINGQQLVRDDGGKLSDVHERDYFQGAVKGQVFLSSILISKATGSRIIIPAVPVYDYGYTSVIGVAQRSYDLSTLHTLLASNVKANQRTFITDKNGIVIARSDQEIKSDDPEDNRSDRDFFKSVSAGTTSGTYVSNGDEKLIVSYRQEPNTGWIVVVSSDYNATMASAKRSAYIIVIVGVIMALVAAVISFFLAKSFTEPLNEVNTALSHLAEGRFVNIEKFHNRKDEFGDMVNNTNSVLSVLDDIVKNIKESAVAVHKSSEDLADSR